MPRLARLDAPGVLHHVMGRGIGRKKIFLNDAATAGMGICFKIGTNQPCAKRSSI